MLSRGWDGERQQEIIEPKDATSPTVSTEVVILTSTTNTLEGKYVAVVDTTWAYLSTDMDNDLRAVFRGALEEMMVSADPALHRPFMSYGLSVGSAYPENGQM